jgi:hypothetical protein
MVAVFEGPAGGCIWGHGEAFFEVTPHGGIRAENYPAGK